MISSIEYSTDSENRCPITVYTREAMREASTLRENIESILYLAIFADFALFAVIYAVKAAKKKD